MWCQSKVRQNFVAFSEYMNLKWRNLLYCAYWLLNVCRAKMNRLVIILEKSSGCICLFAQALQFELENSILASRGVECLSEDIKLASLWVKIKAVEGLGRCNSCSWLNNTASNWFLYWKSNFCQNYYQKRDHPFEMLVNFHDFWCLPPPLAFSYYNQTWW